jgi:hypothetical protein
MDAPILSDTKTGNRPRTRFSIADVVRMNGNEANSLRQQTCCVQTLIPLELNQTTG